MGIIQSLGLVAPASAKQLQRVVSALQHSLMWDAATPSHCHVISVASVNAAADLSRGFPPCRDSLQTLLARIAASGDLSPRVRIAAAEAELLAGGTRADDICRTLAALLTCGRSSQESAAILSAAALLLSSATEGGAGGQGANNGDHAGMGEVPPDTLAVLRAELQSHGTPGVRHEAYRVVCAAMGQPTSLVQMAQYGASEAGDEPTAQRAPPPATWGPRVRVPAGLAALAGACRLFRGIGRSRCSAQGSSILQEAAPGRRCTAHVMIQCCSDFCSVCILLLVS